MREVGGNLDINEWYRIKIPNGYIHNTTYFYEKYYLEEIVKTWQVQANMWEGEVFRSKKLKICIKEKKKFARGIVGAQS